MPNKKISELPASGALTGAELVELVQGGINVQSTAQDIADLGGGGGGTVTSVSGTTNRITSTGGTTPVIDIDAAYDVAIASALALKAPLASPDLTGTPTVPTAAAATNTTQAASTAFVQQEIAGKQNLVNSPVALTDAASMDLTAIKHTLTTSSATRTFTISYTGDDISLKVILNATSSVFTFPAGALCVNSDGSASGDNTCSLTGASGDVYVFAVKNWGSSVYTVVCKNTLQ